MHFNYELEIWKNIPVFGSQTHEYIAKRNKHTKPYITNKIGVKETSELKVSISILVFYLSSENQDEI